jgi:predicted phage terminase large subunit-like protein
MKKRAQEKKVFRPQPGPQEAALSCGARVLLLGGAKGGGKSWLMRYAPIRYLNEEGYHAVIFRRSLPQIQNSGGQWDKSFEIYPYLGGRPHRSHLRWKFPIGSTIRFWHLQDDNNWLDWQGTETAFFGFDQLEEFTQLQFLKILGCNRTLSDADTQIVCTMNPDADSWVAKLVAPWIADDGYVDLELNGKVFWFTIDDGEIKWVDKTWRDSNNQPPISIAYFSADVWDNPILLESDPNYLSALQSQSLVDRERFLGIKGRGGNWKVRPVAGKVFRAEWFKIVDRVPVGIIKTVRFWDFASTAKENKGDDPDWTAGVRLGLLPENRVIVLDVVRFQGTPETVNRRLIETTRSDGPSCPQRWQRDPGQAGVHQDYTLRSLLTGYDAMGVLIYQSKYERAKPGSRAAELGKIDLLEGSWNQDFTVELSGAPDGDHDDQMDGFSGAYNELINPVEGIKSPQGRVNY